MGSRVDEADTGEYIPAQRSIADEATVPAQRSGLAELFAEVRSIRAEVAALQGQAAGQLELAALLTGQAVATSRQMEQVTRVLEELDRRTGGLPPAQVVDGSA